MSVVIEGKDTPFGVLGLHTSPAHVYRGRRAPPVPDGELAVDSDPALRRPAGAALELRSVLGGGTTFSIRLPATRREGTEGEQGGEPDERWLGRDRVVLVLDDDPTVLELVDVALMGAGCDVVVTSDVSEALGAAQERSFDLLILDLNMPKISGWQAFDRFREIDPGLPVLIATGFGSAAEARERGAQGLLPKPNTPDQLVQAVATLIAGSPRRASRA